MAEFQCKVAVVYIVLKPKLTVYIDPKVEPPSHKQDITKKNPKSYKTNQTGIISTFLSDKIPQKPQSPLILG